MEVENSFKVALYMKPFYPSDIHLESGDDNSIIIHAKHDEHIDQHGFVKRELFCQYKLPNGISVTKLKSEFRRNGIMIIRTVQDVQSNLSEENPELMTLEENEQTENIEKKQSCKTAQGIKILDIQNVTVDSKNVRVFDDIDKQKFEYIHGMKPSSTLELSKLLRDHQRESSSKATNVSQELGVEQNLQSTSTGLTDIAKLTSPLSSVERRQIIKETDATCSLQAGSTETIKVKDVSSSATPSPESTSSEIETTDSVNSPMSTSSETVETVNNQTSTVTENMDTTETAHGMETPRDAMEHEAHGMETSPDIMEQEAYCMETAPDTIKDAPNPQDLKPISSEKLEDMETLSSIQSNSSHKMDATDTDNNPQISSSTEAMQTNDQLP